MELLILASARRLARTPLRGIGPSTTTTPGAVRYMAAAAAAASASAPRTTTPRRTTYARAKPAGTTTSTYRRASPAAAAAAAPTPSPEGPLESVPSISASTSADDFPMPQNLAELPDYANLAPPEVFDIPAPPASIASSAPGPAAGLPAGGLAGRGLPGEEPVRADEANDWGSSFHGLSAKPFDKDVAARLMRPLGVDDVECKPDGLLYLPEIKYRRTLNEAFGPGGWGLAPRGETNVGPRIVSREWGLVCLGRLASVARGEQEYFDPSGIPTATEACKSNALMRCCKDLGIASELWDPSFIRQFKKDHCVEAFVEHAVNKKKRKLWRKKSARFEYPYKEV